MTSMRASQVTKNITANTGNIGLSKRIFCTFSILPPVSLYLLSYKIIPQFAETFSTFGTNLPKETLFILLIHPALIWLAALSFFPALIWLNRVLSIKAQKMLFSFAIGHVFFSFMALIFFIWSLYAPIVAVGGTP